MLCASAPCSARCLGDVAFLLVLTICLLSSVDVVPQQNLTNPTPAYHLAAAITLCMAAWKSFRYLDYEGSSSSVPTLPPKHWFACCHLNASFLWFDLLVCLFVFCFCWTLCHLGDCFAFDGLICADEKSYMYLCNDLCMSDGLASRLMI